MINEVTAFRCQVQEKFQKVDRDRATVAEDRDARLLQMILQEDIVGPVADPEVDLEDDPALVVAADHDLCHQVNIRNSDTLVTGKIQADHDVWVFSILGGERLRKNFVEFSNDMVDLRNAPWCTIKNGMNHVDLDS